MEKESNKLMVLDAPELQSIEKSKAEQIRNTFIPMSEMLAGFESDYNKIIAESKKEITSELTAKAKRLRLDIGKVRIQTGKIKDEQKAEYLRAGKAIQAVHNILVWAVQDKEDKLKEIENHFENLEKERLEKLQTSRANELSKYIEDAHERNLSGMDEDVWAAYLSAKKKEFEDRKEAEKQAELQRIENERLDKLALQRKEQAMEYRQFWNMPGYDFRKMSEETFQQLMSELKADKLEWEKEQEKIKAENERLRKEAEEKERLAKIEAGKREKAEKERLQKEEIKRKKLAEKAQKEREENEAKLKAEREKREKLEREIQVKKDAEEKAERERIAKEKAEKEKEEAEAKKKAQSPDKIKLIEAINSLKFEVPEMKTLNGQMTSKVIEEKFNAFKIWALNQTKEL